MEYNYNTGTPAPATPPNPQRNEAEELKRKNKMLMYTLIGIAAALLVGAAAYFLTRKKTETTVADKKTDTVSNYKVAPPTVMPADSVVPVATGNEYDEYEESPYGEEFNISNEAFVRSAPSATAEKVGSLKFGNKVWTDNSYSSNAGFKKVYLSDPTAGQRPAAYYVADYVLTYSDQFEQFKKYFSLPPFSTIGIKMKRIILDNDYNDGRNYEVTQNAERAKTTFAYGDYDQDGITDLAVVLDNNENQYSRLLILCTNAATNEPYLAYADNFSDKVQINSFKKNALIYMWSESLINAPADGVMIRNEGTKTAVVYDRASQKFKVYDQEPSSEYDE